MTYYCGTVMHVGHVCVMQTCLYFADLQVFYPVLAHFCELPRYGLIFWDVFF